MSKAIGRIAGERARQEFDDKIDESLQKGDGWIHRWCKDEHTPSSVFTSNVVSNNLPHGMSYNQLKVFLNGYGPVLSIDKKGQQAIVHFEHSSSGKQR